MALIIFVFLLALLAMFFGLRGVALVVAICLVGALVTEQDWGAFYTPAEAFIAAAIPIGLGTVIGLMLKPIVSERIARLRR